MIWCGRAADLSAQTKNNTNSCEIFSFEILFFDNFLI